MADRSIHEFPTDAFGQVEFLNEDEGSIKPSKYDQNLNTIADVLKVSL